MAESAVRYFVPDHPQTARTLLGKLNELRAKKAQAVVDGYSQDWSDYRYRVGEIKALTEAIDICEQDEQEK